MTELEKKSVATILQIAEQARQGLSSLSWFRSEKDEAKLNKERDVFFELKGNIDAQLREISSWSQVLIQEKD